MKRMNHIVRLFIFICCIVSGVGLAQVNSTVSALEMLKGVSSNMVSSLQRNQTRLSDANVIYRIVNEIVVPHIAIDRMAGSVVGRQYWASATPQQQKDFIAAFKRLVISTYGAALSAFNNDKIRFYPMRQLNSTRRTVQVNSVIIRRSGQKIPVAYKLIRMNHGWKIYDFSIENISMTKSYQAQFASVLARTGMSGLIRKLRLHNRTVR